MFYRWLAIVSVGLIGPLVGTADEPKPDPPKSLAEQFAAIKKELQERQKQFQTDYRTHRNDDKKRSEIANEYSDFTQKQADKLKSLIKKHGKEPAVFEGVLILTGEMYYSLDDDIVRLVLEHHFTNDKMGQLCFDIRRSFGDAWREKILGETAAKHPNPAVRGQAEYALGAYYRWGAQGYMNNIPEATAQERFAEAAKHFTEVTKNYAAFTTPDGKAKLGERAAGELVRIQNIPNLKVGKPAPEIVGEDLDGKPFKLSDYRGKVVLLDVWGHW
jgi:hypothetical protein